MTSVSLLATSASRHVVDLLVVANVGEDYRDLMNAGKALLRLAKFESASQSAERGRPPMRGKRDSGIRSDGRAEVRGAAAFQSAQSGTLVAPRRDARRRVNAGLADGVAVAAASSTSDDDQGREEMPRNGVTTRACIDRQPDSVVVRSWRRRRADVARGVRA